jgi:division/cell wall cluster transcriptional repressor MraZ
MLVVDEKSRLLVPAEVRRKLDAEDTDVFVIKIGNNGKVWLYPERFYDAKVYDDGAGTEGDEIDPSPEQLERMLSRSADIYRVPMDKAGRILLPEPVVSLTGLGREVALLGVFNHLQLWNRDDYAKRQLTRSSESQQG